MFPVTAYRPAGIYIPRSFVRSAHMLILGHGTVLVPSLTEGPVLRVCVCAQVSSDHISLDLQSGERPTRGGGSNSI